MIRSAVEARFQVLPNCLLQGHFRQYTLISGMHWIVFAALQAFHWPVIWSCFLPDYSYRCQHKMLRNNLFYKWRYKQYVYHFEYQGNRINKAMLCFSFHGITNNRFLQNEWNIILKDGKIFKNVFQEKLVLSVSEFVFYLLILSVLFCAGFCCISITTIQNKVDKIIWFPSDWDL